MKYHNGKIHQVVKKKNVYKKWKNNDIINMDEFEIKEYVYNKKNNWVNELNNSIVNNELNLIVSNNGNRMLANVRPYYLPERLWLFLLQKVDLKQSKKWNELGKKGINKLVNLLTNDIYEVNGKTTFKEEFVTCGGVSLQSVDFRTMQSKDCSNLYFAGEVLDVDGITGGYNFQAAWTGGYLAGLALME